MLGRGTFGYAWAGAFGTGQCRQYFQRCLVAKANDPPGKRRGRWPNHDAPSRARRERILRIWYAETRTQPLSTDCWKQDSHWLVSIAVYHEHKRLSRTSAGLSFEFWPLISKSVHSKRGEGQHLPSELVYLHRKRKICATFSRQGNDYPRACAPKTPKIRHGEQNHRRTSAQHLSRAPARPHRSTAVCCGHHAPKHKTGPDAQGQGPFRSFRSSTNGAVSQPGVTRG